MAKINTIHYTPDFKKSYQELPPHPQKIVDKKDALFRENPRHAVLHTHKLKGPLKGLWSFYINKSYRVLFEFLEHKQAIFYDVGPHDIYK